MIIGTMAREPFRPQFFADQCADAADDFEGGNRHESTDRSMWRMTISNTYHR